MRNLTSLLLMIILIFPLVSLAQEDEINEERLHEEIDNLISAGLVFYFSRADVDEIKASLLSDHDSYIEDVLKARSKHDTLEELSDLPSVSAGTGFIYLFSKFLFVNKFSQLDIAISTATGTLFSSALYSIAEVDLDKIKSKHGITEPGREVFNEHAQILARVYTRLLMLPHEYEPKIQKGFLNEIQAQLYLTEISDREPESVTIYLPADSVARVLANAQVPEDKIEALQFIRKVSTDHKDRLENKSQEPNLTISEKVKLLEQLSLFIEGYTWPEDREEFLEFKQSVHDLILLLEL